MNNKLLSPAYPAEKSIYLEKKSIHGVEIDICPLSGGIWFDRFELKKFDEANEPLDSILSVLPKFPKEPEIINRRRSPKHPEAIMQQRPYGPKGMNGILTVDLCPMCAGTWLDYKELQKIRELYPTEAEMKQLSQKLVDDAFKKALAK